MYRVLNARNAGLILLAYLCANTVRANCVDWAANWQIQYPTSLGTLAELGNSATLMNLGNGSQQVEVAQLIHSPDPKIQTILTALEKDHVPVFLTVNSKGASKSTAFFHFYPDHMKITLPAESQGAESRYDLEHEYAHYNYTQNKINSYHKDGLTIEAARSRAYAEWISSHEQHTQSERKAYLAEMKLRLDDAREKHDKNSPNVVGLFPQNNYYLNFVTFPEKNGLLWLIRNQPDRYISESRLYLHEIGRKQLYRRRRLFLDGLQPIVANGPANAASIKWNTVKTQLWDEFVAQMAVYEKPNEVNQLKDSYLRELDELYSVLPADRFKLNLPRD